MRFLKSVLPNLTIVLNICMLVIVYLDQRNPMMGFLMGTPFLSLAFACCICSIATAVVQYISWRSGKDHKHSKEKISNNT